MEELARQVASKRVVSSSISTALLPKTKRLDDLDVAVLDRFFGAL
jgi:hypothetical protein